MVAFRTRAELAALPRLFVPDAVDGLDVSTESGLAAARLRLAVDLSRSLKASTLVAVCRAHGLRHISTGVAAAHALASLTLSAINGEIH
jgi:hypothetical protein